MPSGLLLPCETTTASFDWRTGVPGFGFGAGVTVLLAACCAAAVTFAKKLDGIVAAPPTTVRHNARITSRQDFNALVDGIRELVLVVTLLFFMTNFS